ncbi:helix-turn-helix domain-containing protein [Faecalicoccus pleomorphus]|uniref:helix-turn-helix domain-containing protein n=1 Tax=Faecalicoccus pleomorphus TaxID=1323 RepID=UPI00242EDEDE|nr:helix-turn-helix domain-containing protein [Faecalicoccus pleomorphus]
METIFYTIQEVAEILSLSEQTIRKLIHEGELKAVRLGRTYRIPYEALIELRSAHSK